MRVLFSLIFVIGAAACDAAAEPRSISVQGTGVIAVEPDVAIVRMGVDTLSETSRDTLRINSEATNAVIAALKKLGVEDRHIRTESLQLHPRYDHQRDREGRTSQHLVGFQASNIVSVRLEDLSQAGEAIDVATTAGANRVDGIRFEVGNPDEVLQHARDAAWGDARAQAEQLVSLAGAGLGPVLKIVTHGGTPPQPREMAFAGVRMDSVPVSGGQQNISVQLHVTWELINN